MLTQADSKQHYFETAVEHEISSSNIYTIILKFSYDFIALTVLSFDMKQNKINQAKNRLLSFDYPHV